MKFKNTTIDWFARGAVALAIVVVCVISIAPAATISSANLYSQAIPVSFEQVAFSDTSGGPSVTVQAGQSGKVIKVWRWFVRVSGGGNFGAKSSGGRVLLPSGGGVSGSTQYSVMDLPNQGLCVPWFVTDSGEDLVITYDAGTINGFVTFTIELAGAP